MVRSLPLLGPAGRVPSRDVLETRRLGAFPAASFVNFEGRPVLFLSVSEGITPESSGEQRPGSAVRSGLPGVCAAGCTHFVMACEAG